MDLDALLRSQHGVCSVAQALEAGLTEDAIRWRVSSKRWSRIGRGLYRAQTGELDWLGRAHAAVLRGGADCALSLRAAEHLHGVAATPPPVITVVVPSGRSVTRLPGTRFRSHVGLQVVRRRGLPVTSAEQTVLDLAGRARHRHRRILTVALGVVAEGAESLMEVSFVRRVEQPHGLPRASMQVPDGTVRRDVEYDRWLVVVEVDGRLGHEGEHLAADRRRDRRAAGTGRVTLRAGWVDVEGDPCRLALDVYAALRARGLTDPIRACGPRCAARRLVAA